MNTHIGTITLSRGKLILQTRSYRSRVHRRNIIDGWGDITGLSITIRPYIKRILSLVEIREIIMMSKTVSRAELAEQYGVSKAVIQRYLSTNIPQYSTLVCGVLQPHPGPYNPSKDMVILPMITK